MSDEEQAQWTADHSNEWTPDNWESEFDGGAAFEEEFWDKWNEGDMEHEGEWDPAHDEKLNWTEEQWNDYIMGSFADGLASGDWQDGEKPDNWF
jgi:hypothetical protein